MSAATSFARLAPSASGQRRSTSTTTNNRAEWASGKATAGAGRGQFVAGGGLTQRCFHAPFPRSSTISAFGKPSPRIWIMPQHGGVAPTASAGHHTAAATASASRSSEVQGRAGVVTAVVRGGTPSLFTRRGDSLRANAWLGDWMKDNLGGGDKNKKGEEGQRKGTGAGGALKGGGNTYGTTEGGSCACAASIAGLLLYVLLNIYQYTTKYY